MKKNINTVYLETDLSVFKTLDGNRSVEPARVDKIVRSIQKVGFVPSPIVVNECMEVIDGQGRLEACKQLNLPIPYIKIPNIGIDECLSMNINQVNWSTIDYVNSWAERGNENYIKLRDFLGTCDFPLQIGIWLMFQSANVSARIRGGTIEVTDEMVDDAVDLSIYLHKFDMIETNRRLQMVVAITFAIKVDGVTRDGLERAITKNPRAFTAISDVADCIGVIEDVYNKGKRAHRVYLRHAYEVKMNETMIASMVKGKNRWVQAHRTNSKFEKEAK